MTRDDIGPLILRNFRVAVLFSIFCNLVLGCAGGITEANGHQQTDSQGEQTTTSAPDSVKAAQDLQKYVDEAMSAAEAAKKAADEAKNSKSSAESAAEGAKGSANAAQTSAASTDKSKAEAADAAQKAGSAAGEGRGAAETAKKDAAKVAEGGIALKGSTNVKDYVNIQVVLLPRKQAERVFSKEIARHYAVVQVIIDNKSEDAAFVLHSIFADYAGWALSGVPSSAEVTSALAVTGGSSSSGGPCPQEPDNAKATAYQTVSCAGQVASIESRVIRGELLDASTWTPRNSVIRAAVLVGAVAAGIPAFGSKNALKYVGAYNGQLVPGTEVFWPDGTVSQLNRVSDFGFQTNKVFAKGDSDPVYAFFPLDRFLTPGMKDIFLNAPAVFFAPAQIFVDKHVGKLQPQVDEMKNLIEDLVVPPIPPLCDENNVTPSWQVGTITAIATSGGSVTLTLANTMKQGDVVTLAGLTKNPALNTGGIAPVTLTAATPTTVSFASTATIASGDETGTVTATAKACFTQKQRDREMLRLLTKDCSKTGDTKTDDGNAAACAPTLAARNLLNAISLNSANILVQGVMTVNVAIVPATITDITFDEGNDSSDVWTVTGKDHAATMTGSFLTGGVPSVTSIDLPTGQNEKSDKYIDPKTISAVSEGSTDTKLNFKLQLKKKIDPGSKLHFQVTKYDPKDTKKASGVKSMDFVLPVNYVHIDEVTLGKGDTAATLTGHITGSGLDGATPEVVTLSLKNGTSATLDLYLEPAKVDTSKTNDGGNLHFTLKLKNEGALKDSKLTFKVTKNAAAGAEKGQAVESNPYTVNYK